MARGADLLVSRMKSLRTNKKFRIFYDEVKKNQVDLQKNQLFHVIVKSLEDMMMIQVLTNTKAQKTIIDMPTLRWLK